MALLKNLFFVANLVNSCLRSLPQLISALQRTVVTLYTTSLISKSPALSCTMLGLCMIIRLNYDYFPQQQDILNVD
jgi:hypothetical protein